MSTTKPKSKPKKPSVTFATRAGITLSPAYVHGRMKRVAGKRSRIGKGAVAFTAGSMDFLLRDMLRQVVERVLTSGVVRIRAAHVGGVIQDDPDLASALGQGFMPGVRVVGGDATTWREKKREKAKAVPAKKKQKKPKAAEQEAATE
jgi:hypothetical protein